MNKFGLKFLVCLLLLNGCGNLSENVSKNQKIESSNSTDETPVLRKFILTGKAINTTLNIKGSVELEIVEIEPNKFKCTGKFGEKNLFGRLDLNGEKYENRNSPNSLSLKFKGQIHLGDNDGSGFSPGTKAAFYTDIEIFSDNATGEYLIEEIIDSDYTTEKQDGLFNLKIKSSN